MKPLFCAAIVQWIERGPAKAEISVRLRVAAPLVLSLSMPHFLDKVRRLFTGPLLAVVVLTAAFAVGFFFRDQSFPKIPLPPSSGAVTETEAAPVVSIQPASSSEKIKDGNYLVAKVLDGDTIVLTNGEHVRYLGLDAPEKNGRYEITAAEHNSALVLGKTVRLELDKKTRDVYGRLLAYVWVEKILVNEKLLQDGDARAYFVRGETTLKYRDRLLAAEQWGRDHHHGLWLDEWLQ